jgi:enamine deaminase RidA (YjgF/YER057c/UK114 family)
MIEKSWSEVAGLRLMRVRVGGSLNGRAEAQAIGLLEGALAELERDGFAPDRLVRSRVWARNAELRRTASDARLLVLTGERRAASASFITPSRLPDGIDVAFDLVALEGTGSKTVQEYEPRIAPPRFLKREGLVFLSGITDTAGDFAAQLRTVIGLIGQSLAAAGTAQQSILDVKAFVHHSIAWKSAHDAIRAHFTCPVDMTSVEGYSAPEKRLEIEVTARG